MDVLGLFAGSCDVVGERDAVVEFDDGGPALVVVVVQLPARKLFQRPTSCALCNQALRFPPI